MVAARAGMAGAGSATADVVDVEEEAAGGGDDSAAAPTAALAVDVAECEETESAGAAAAPQPRQQQQQAAAGASAHGSSAAAMSAVVASLPFDLSCVAPSWLAALQAEFQKPYFAKLGAFVRGERAKWARLLHPSLCVLVCMCGCSL